MKFYLKVVGTIFVLFGTYAFLVPSLISAQDTIMVLAGFVVAFATPLGLIATWRDDIGKVYDAATAIKKEGDKESTKTGINA